MTQRVVIPGGLRAQVIAALCVLSAIALGFTGNMVEDLLVQRSQHEKQEQAMALAVTVTQIQTLDELNRLREGASATWLHAKNAREGSQRESGSLPFEPEYGSQGIFYHEGTEVVVVRARRGDVVAQAALPLTESLGAARRQAGLLWALLAIESVVFLAFGYAFFTLFVVRPIRAIKVATDRAAAGDLASPISVLPRNEFGEVGTSFNEMLKQLEESQSSLEAQVEELARANDEIQRTQDRLIRSENLASVGQLAAGVAHEIGNPLAVLSGYTEILLDDDLEAAERVDTLARMQTQVVRIQGIIRTLLDYSRADDGVLESTSVAAVVHETISLGSVTSKAKGVRIESEAEDAQVLAIGSQLIQVCLNLVLNAVDAMNTAEVDDPYVRFRTENSEGRVRLIIEDNGPGIPDEVRSRIFDPFFTTKDPGEGTGLGLAVSLRIVESFDGSIEIGRSELGGAKFELTFREAG